VTAATPTTTATPAEVESRSLRTLREILESGRPLTYIRSSEEQRIGALLQEAAQRFFASPIRCGPGR